MRHLLGQSSCCCSDIPLFLPLSARWAFFVSRQRSETKTIHLQTEQNEGSEGGEAGVVGGARDKHALSFGAGQAYPNGLHKARSTGRPPLRTEVGPSRASAPHRVWFLGFLSLTSSGHRFNRNQEPLLALLHMHFRGGLQEAEAPRLVHSV
jgi:hypothetical protein